MNILHLNQSDLHGGAARAAFRLNNALNKFDVNSNMLVQKKIGDQINTKTVINNKIDKVWAKSRLFLDKSLLRFYRNNKPGKFSIGYLGKDISDFELVKQSDIIHLHWINGGFLSTKSIKKLKKLNKPIVWTLHDMWPFTGGCHYSDKCEKYKDKCGNCDFLNSSKDNDLSRRIWKRKKEAYNDLDLTIVSCSKWLGNCAEQSSLFSDSPVKVIPNTLNLDIFKPIDKNTAREILNLSTDAFIILFGAIKATADKRKGYKYLKDGLIELRNKYNSQEDKIILMVFGSSYSEDVDKLPYNTKFMGRLSDEYTLALCYNAADVFVAPSLADNLPNTIMESLACGTPVVAFNAGGIPDMITHKYNGYLAEYKSAIDLARGIDWVLEDKTRYKKLSENARTKVEDSFDNKIIAGEYIDLYKKLFK